MSAVFFFGELGALNIGNQSLSGKARGVVAAAVFVTLVNARAFLDERTAREDRWHHRTGSGLG